MTEGAAPAVVDVRGLSKRFGRLQALRDVSFSVAAGEIFGFLGPNGAGKTTTIKILLGLLKADGGDASIGGYNVATRHLDAARVVGSATEVPGYYGYLTGRQNLRQFARTLGKPDEGQIQQLLDTVGLHQRGDDRVKRYSLGMRQRLSVAQALLGTPRVLILDEPTNGLDPGGMVELRHLLRRLAKEEGLTVFFSSHLLGEVEEICDRVAVIGNGEVRAIGRLDELLRTGNNTHDLRVGDAEAALQLLQASGWTKLQRGDRDGLIRVVSEEDDGARLLRALLDGGIRIESYSRGERRLEDLFLELTGKPS